ncbi:hypothetical protein [Caldimonas tepidiphila]|uniref:hypothetical protein n=1 Tax=Caldimonas tepidiphila TaxID=2315841 RepID=UPI000E5A6938|nr:hypothetical protein [Caldimonas tepidiphila]
MPADPQRSLQEGRGAEARRLLHQLRAAPPAAQAGLRLQLRDNLEAFRAALLGRSSRVPEALRHHAVSLTEVQWLLDAWIAGSGGGDEAQLRHDFFDAASRLFDDGDEEAPLQAPRRARWWARWWTALRGPRRAVPADGKDEGAAAPARPL